MNTKNYKKNNSMKTVAPKKKTIDRNQLLAYLLAVLIIFWTVASVFGMIAYARTKKSNSANVVKASAQTVEDFVENERLIITNPIKNFVIFDDANSESITTLFGYDFYFGDTSLGLFTGNVEYPYTHGSTQEEFYSILYDGSLDLDSFQVGLNSTAYSNDYFDSWTSIEYYIAGESIVQNGLRHLIFYHTFSFTNSVQGYTEVARFTFDYSLNYLSSSSSLVVYFPNANDGASHEWSVDGNDYQSNPTAGGFDTTDFLLYYYSVDTGNFDIAYGNGYDKGYEIGIADARRDTYDKGYREGRIVGRQEGYDEGFIAGVNDANNYSFDGLISAVFDVPVRTFFSFFSFEILGIDLSSFFLSLFAIAVFLAVVRFIF